MRTVSTVEERLPGHKCGKDEVPVEGALRDVDLPAEDDEDDDDDAGEEGAARGSARDKDEPEPEPEDLEGADSDDSGGWSVDLEETIAKRRGGQ